MYSLSQMVIVLILFTSQPYGRIIHPVGKSYAINIEAEKAAVFVTSRNGMC